MRLHYQKYSPTGNITLLVTTPVPRSAQPGVAARLLETAGGEQVGFIEPAADPACPARLQMMGSEFCGNATMSLGAMLARERGLAAGESLDLLLEVSGSDTPVPCRIQGCHGDGPPDTIPQSLPPMGKVDLPENACIVPGETEEVPLPSPFLGTVQMPLPTAIGEVTLPADAGPLTVPLVALPGISHLILPAGRAPGEAELRRRLPEWDRALAADALGALVFDADALSIDPLVWVPSAGTLVREHGCGSGTAAVGAWLAHTAGRDIEAAIAQPGGAITVKAALSGGRIAALSITGRVTLLEEADVELG